MSPGPQQSTGAAGAASERKTVPRLQEASPRDTQPRLHLARCWATPCQDRTAEEEGGAWAGPGAAGARLGPSAHGKECSFLRRPAQRVPPATPWHCRVQPYGGWGLFTAEASRLPYSHQPSLCFCAQKGPKETWVCTCKPGGWRVPGPKELTPQACRGGTPCLEQS